MTSSVQYEREGKAVKWRFPSPAGDGDLMFLASEVRRESNAGKAYIKVGIPGDAVKAADDLKLRDDGERGALANRAAEQLWGVRYSDPKAAVLRERMLVFCDGLMEFWIGAGSGEYVEGDAEPSESRWAAVGLVLYGATGIDFGNAGAGKSTLYRLIAQSFMYDVATLIPIRKRADVIWVNAEEPPEEHTRQLGNVNQALGLQRNSPLYTIDARGLSMGEIAPRIERAIAATGAEHVFIDSLSRLAQGMNLNENATATLLVDSVAGMGTSMNWIGHTGQENEYRLGGSKHFTNAARLMVRVQSRPSVGGVSPELRRGLRVTVFKANGAAESDPQFYTLTYHRQHGLTGAEKAEPGEWPMLRCDFEYAEGKFCRRTTWDGVFAGLVRCPRHREEEGD